MSNGVGRFYPDARYARVMSSLFRSTGDLLLVVVWTSFAVAAVLSGIGPGPLRTVATLPLVVLFPGYALLAFLFPERPGAGTDEGASISHVERAALSIVLSLAVVPTVAFVMNYTSYGIRLRPLLVVVSLLTVVLAVIAYLARIRLPDDHRFGVHVGAWLAGGTDRFLSNGGRRLRDAGPLQPTTGTQRLLNLFLVVSVLALVATAGYAAVTPPANDDPFTEFYLQTQNGDGEFVTENLPHEFSQGQSQTLYATITNQEGQRVPYTVVVQLEGKELDRVSTSIDAGRTKRIEQTIAPSQSGDRLRLSFLLYRGNVPENPTPENAYRETHLWISVSG